jgi:hypothetical protein
LSLASKRVLFTRLLGQLLGHATEQGWHVALGEGYINSTRTVSVKEDSGEKLFTARDRVHHPRSLHYLGLAVDLLLYEPRIAQDGTEVLDWVKDGGHPTYALLGQFWKHLHPQAAWGGDFESVDSNHFSLAHEGMK